MTFLLMLPSYSLRSVIDLGVAAWSSKILYLPLWAVEGVTEPCVRVECTCDLEATDVRVEVG